MGSNAYLSKGRRITLRESRPYLILLQYMKLLEVNIPLPFFKN
jgi:hypothetical protein